MKDNKLIAEFMGTYNYNEEWTDKANDEQYEYHTSWDALMPVVEKIENDFDISFEIIDDNCFIKGDFSFSAFEHSKIESVYRAVVEFIVWHNKEAWHESM